MIELILNFFSHYLIQFMSSLLVLGLLFRWFAFRASKFDELYFSAFTRELTLILDADKNTTETREEANIEKYLVSILGRIAKKLPNRTLRFSPRKPTSEPDRKTKDTGSNSGKVSSLRDYVDGKQGLIVSIQAESSVFNCKTPPHFMELTRRIMNQDNNWNKLFDMIPIEGVSRMIDILPGLFIVFGVFGTFIGISMALPEIAQINFDNLEASGAILSRFVTNVTFSMETSIAGIFFSVMMTVLNTLYPIKDSRNRTFKKLENALQALWYHLQKDQSEEKTLGNILGQLLTTLNLINDNFKGNSESSKKVKEGELKIVKAS
jgi:hypothetical protein